MPKINSQINTGSEEFRANRAAMQALAADLAQKRAITAEGGPKSSRDRHVARGKLLPRDRVMRLIDPGSPFLELSQMAAWDMYGGDIHGAGVITGVGRVSGRECVIVCNDATIKGGTYYPLTVKKDRKSTRLNSSHRT